jgi:hypothetical protein
MLKLICQDSLQVVQTLKPGFNCQHQHMPSQDSLIGMLTGFSAVVERIRESATQGSQVAPRVMLPET